MSFAPLDLLAAHKWERATFTTYALSLSFVEAIILDELVRTGGAEALILADVEGVRASLSELGAQRVGKDYDVEPVVVSGGVFHPKVTVLGSRTECHVLIGSGNLTFNGWGGNLELVEHLHPSFAASAIGDLAGFFEMLGTANRIRHHAQAACKTVADDLRRASETGPPNPGIRVLHSLGPSIREQVVRIAEELGGATRVLAAAPYWDGGAAISELCSSLGIERVSVHAHPAGCVAGAAAPSWPHKAGVPVDPVRVQYFDEEKSRKLHAKAFEILCRNGRVIVSGSANASEAALGLRHNVEVCVARIHQRRSTGWTFVPSTIPFAVATEGESEGSQAHSGVLRATLEADELTGTILTPRMTGEAVVHYLGSVGAVMLGPTSVDAEGQFSIHAPKLENQSWRGGRLVIRVQDSTGRTAEGFVSVAALGDLVRRAGQVGRRFFAFLAGAETPADVAVIMDWFHQNPQHLLSAAHTRNAHSTGRTDSEQLVPVASLANVAGIASAGTPPGNHPSGKRWTRFMQHVYAAFSEARGPLGGIEARPTDDEEEPEEANTGTESSESSPQITKALETLDKLVGILTSEGAPPHGASVALMLVGYACDRLRPPHWDVSKWLTQVFRAVDRVGIEPGHYDALIAAIIATLGASPVSSMYRWARERLTRVAVDLSSSPPVISVTSFASVLPQLEPLEKLWAGIAATRTFREQVAAYHKALQLGVANSSYPDLPVALPEEWPALEGAITSKVAARRLVISDSDAGICPDHFISLPPTELQKMETIGIATARNCCGRIIIRVV